MKLKHYKLKSVKKKQNIRTKLVKYRIVPAIYIVIRLNLIQKYNKYTLNIDIFW